MRYMIDGNPLPLARTRIGRGSRRVYDMQRDIKIVHGICLQNQHGERPLFIGPLELDVTFYLKMPKLTSRQILERNNIYHFYKPDLSNLIKFVEDIANEIIYKDDAQISSIVSRKVYHEHPRTEFCITPLGKNDKYENQTP